MSTRLFRPLTLALACLSSLQLYAAPEAFEIGPHNKEQLPGGKEADGIIGDFLLRNDKVEAVISHNALFRRANMSTFYGDNGITPGCLYDLTLRGANNDQITVFTPSGQQGIVSYVRVAKDGKDGEASVETVITAANNNGIYKQHEYKLRDGWQGVWITTTWRNEGKEARKGTVDDRWTTFGTNSTGKAGSFYCANAVDPADKAGYAYAWIEKDGLKAPPSEIELKPGEEITYARFLAVGRSPLEAVGELSAVQGATGTVTGSTKDQAGTGVATATVNVKMNGKWISGYPDANGAFKVKLPAGTYEVETSDIGRDTVKQTITVTTGKDTALNVKLSAASTVVFDIRDAAGNSIPCKAQFLGTNGTKNPNLGPNNRARGCVDQYHSEKGQFRVQLPPGTYDIIVTHGTEFSHLRQRVELAPGKTMTVKGALKRLVDTTGWISSDFHNHSTPSGDNTCGTDDRIINLVAEQIEFAPTTEHNRLYDWRPHIQKLGLTHEINTVSGMELTGSAAHYNSFPFTPEPFTQDNGAPKWNPDPRITAITLRNHQKGDPDRWIQINHPDMVENFIDRDGDGRADGGFTGLPMLIDGVEAQNYSPSEILGGVPYRVAKDSKSGRDTVQTIREFVWLQLLNQGHRYVGMAVCDAHAVYGNGVGGWRMYFPSRSDKPAEIDWREISKHAKAGRSILTTGPFLDLKAEDGTLAGGSTRASGSIKLHVKVQCTDWMDIDRVQVLVNGRQRSDVNFTRKSHPKMFRDGVVKFDETISVRLSEDSHLIVVATGENTTLTTGYGTSGQSKLKSIAYNNPIFVDADGGGFKPNGDNLGWDLPVKKQSVEEVRAMLKKHAGE